nr:unnamed protein product [Spirometra erinaceieuropaei]
MSHSDQQLDAPAQSFHATNFTLPEFWQHAPELYFIGIESSFYSANVTKELAKYHKLVEVLPANIISQVQPLLVKPPADAPYSALKAEIHRLNAVSDRQRYHQLIKEESLGNRKPSELLRRMRTLLGGMQVDEKLVKEMFLERLPADVQTILASGSQDLTLSHLAEMADRMIEAQQFQPPSVAQISTSSSTVNEQLLQQMSTMANEIAYLKLQLALWSQGPREISHLDYISQFTTDIRHIDGPKNEVADMLSRPSLSSLQLSHGIDRCAMAAEQQRVGCPGDESVSGLQLKDVPLTTGSGTILCDVSTPFHRPFVSASMRRAVFQTLHGLSHPGIRASQKLLAESHVHLDVVGPLPPSNGFTYLLTCVDRYTRWAEAIPLPNVQAETIVKAFVSCWVAMFGAPSTVTTDRGAQFESALFQTLLNFLGCTRIRTTAYHPAANGMVERFHRQLKTALRAVEDPGNWSDNLPLALLGIRAALKSDLGCSAAELVFGTTLRLPGEMITPTSRGADETPDNLVHRLRQFMRSLSPVPPRAPMTESYVEKELDKCTHVFVRCDRVRQPLESPYEGPFRVLARNAKTFRILRSDKEDVVSVDRVKAAVAEEPPDRSQGQTCADPLTPVPPSSLSPTRSPCPLPCPSPPLPSTPPSRILPLPTCQQHPTATPSSTTARSQPSSTIPPAYITRSGRHVHFPDRLVTHFFLDLCISSGAVSRRPPV